MKTIGYNKNSFKFYYNTVPNVKSKSSKGLHLGQIRNQRKLVKLTISLLLFWQDSYHISIAHTHSQSV